MILTLDIGNTNIKTALFDGKEMRYYWRMSTNIQKSSDEYGIVLVNLFQHVGVRPEEVEGIMISSVVPTINFTIEHMCQNYFGQTPLFVVPGIKTGINIRYENPRELGSDRIANAVAAETFYGAPAIVVDFGTATNIDVIDEDGYYIGGAIAPGIRISMDALAARAAKLASVPLEAPEHAIGRDTEECIKVGAVTGAAAMAEGLVARMKRELGREDATVIATGGLASIVADSTDAFDIVDGQLTIKGICEIYRRMQELG